MKILLLNHTLDHYSGSETFSFALASELKRTKHDVVCFSPRLGRLADRLQEADIPVTNSLAAVPDDIDVIHAHHRQESLLAFARFPDKPMILACHGVLPWQETPFRSRLNIHRYVAVSEEVRDRLVRHHGLRPSEVLIVRNGIDLRRFHARRPIRPRPRHALILSNYMPESHRSLVASVCRQHGITLDEVGKGRSRWTVEEEINRADLVFGLGRSALEALACKRVVIVFDYNGADGLVTPENFHQLRLRNFSGRTHGRQYTEETLGMDIERYDPSTVEPIYEMVRRDHDVRQMAQTYVGLYEDAIRQPLGERPEPEELALRRYWATAELVDDTDRLRALVADRDRSLQVIHESRGWRVLSAARKIRRGVRGLLGRPPSPVRRKARILIVDDDRLLTRRLVEALAAEGHEVHAVHDGHGALHRLEKRTYDLILSDLRMPQMDGVELYRRLEREQPDAARQVMFLRSHGDAADYESFLSELRDRSLAKPVDLADIQRLVRRSLSATRP